MPYEINVTKNGAHYFATHPRSLTSLNIKDVVEDFRKRFPVSEGFNVDLFRIETRQYKETPQ